MTVIYDHRTASPTERHPPGYVTSTDPVTTYGAGGVSGVISEQWWFDAASGIIRIRNDANDDWDVFAISTSSLDLSSPPAIGDVNPNTGGFTTAKISEHLGFVIGHTDFLDEDQAAIYISADDSASYPFDGSGHLVIQGASDGGAGDIVFVTGDTGAVAGAVEADGALHWYGSGDFDDSVDVAIDLTVHGDLVVGATAGLARAAIVGSANEKQLVVRRNATQTANIVEYQSAAGGELSGVRSDGTFFVGVTTTTNPLLNLNGTTQGTIGIQQTSTVQSASDSLAGMSIVGQISPSANITLAYGSFYRAILKTSSSNVSSGFYGMGIRAETAADYSGTLANIYTLLIANPIGTGSDPANNYGIYIANQTTGTTANYAIYTNAGTVRIGGTFAHAGATFGILGATPAAQRAHVADPSGGSVIDVAARAAINAILVTLETFGHHSAA